jgi:hypothetical protein
MQGRNLTHLDWIKAEFVKCADDKHDRKQQARKEQGDVLGTEHPHASKVGL